ncbi:LysM peptidoglycan-binding domain-containing protein [Priestia megaterium]|nr:LysM peptidoglycan-binding domain-containing protein [Priestia megaterium]
MKKHILSIGATALVSIGAAGAADAASADTHKVESGETLYSISKKHSVTVEQLKQWNNLSSNTIYTNQTLTLTSKHESSSKTPSTPATNGNTYTVQSGDTLYRIAKNNGVTVAQIKSWNNLSSNVIYVNQTLNVNGQAVPTKPTDEQQTSVPTNRTTYKVQPGDTLWSVAQRHGISVEQVKQWNNLSSNTIYINQTLNIAKGNSVPASTTPTPSESVTEQKPSSSKELTVVATAYTAFCAGCSGITKTGIDLRTNPNQKVIAVDPRVIPLGSRVYVEGYGEAIAGDIGSAIKGNRIDVFIPSQSGAIQWGRRTIKVQVLN